MHWICMIALAFAAALTGYEARAQAPQAADQTFGMALLSATVGSNGVLIHGAGALSSQRNVVGDYYIDFVRSIVNCTIIAGVSHPGGGMIRGFASASRLPATNNRAWVVTSLYTGVQTDLPFAVTVLCMR
jgi:hypothetical protein